MINVKIVPLSIDAELKRVLLCIEVGKPFSLQLCYDVNEMTLHQQALILLYYLNIFKNKLIIAMENYKQLQKIKQLKEFKQLIEELLKEDRYAKVLEALFVVSYPDILQHLQQQAQQQEESKMHT